MNIVFYHDDENGLNHRDLKLKASSGTVMSLLNLAKGLSRKACKVFVLSKAKDIQLDNINYIEIKSEDNVIDWYQSNDVDVFIAVGRTGKILSRVANLKKGKIIYWHHNYLPIDNIAQLAKQKLIDNIVTVSPHHMSSLYKYLLFNNICFIRNPMDFSIFPRVDYSVERSGLAYVGNISKAKGFDSVVKTYYDYFQQGGKEKLNVFGSSDLYSNSEKENYLKEFDEEFVNIINELLENKMLVIHGKVSRTKLYSDLSKIKVLLCGLNTKGGAESAGMGMVEAQYLGCNVLTYNRGGQSDSIYNQNNVCKINKSEVVRKIFEMTEGKFRLNNDASLWLENRYDYELISNDWIRVINGEINKKRHLHAIKARISTMCA